MAFLRKGNVSAWQPKPRTASRNPGRTRKMAAWGALVVGALALMLNIEGANKARGTVTQVVVATHAIAAGTPVPANALTLRPMTGLAHAETDISTVQGKIAVHGIGPGEPITTQMVSVAPERLGLRNGETGLWLSVGLVTSALARAGDRVDVLMANGGSGQGAVPIGQMLATGLRVVAVANSNGQLIGSSGGNSLVNASNAGVPAAVEVGVSPQQALQLVSAESAGTLTLIQAPWGSSTATNGANGASTNGASANGTPNATPLSTGASTATHGTTRTLPHSPPTATTGTQSHRTSAVKSPARKG